MLNCSCDEVELHIALPVRPIHARNHINMGVYSPTHSQMVPSKPLRVSLPFNWLYPTWFPAQSIEVYPRPILGAVHALTFVPQISDFVSKLLTN